MTTDILKDGIPARANERRGALIDLALWLGAVALIAMSFQLLGPALGPHPTLARLISCAQMIALFVLSTVLLRRRGETWRSVGLRAPVSVGRVVGLVVAGYLAVAIMNGVLILELLPKAHVARPAFGALGHMKGDWKTYVFWLVFAWISAAVGEELQFRGFLWSRLERLFGCGRVGTGLTLVIQAAVFGSAHLYQGLGGVLATSAAGLALGGVYLAGRRNLVGDMVLHALIDTVSLTVLFFGLVPGL